MILCSDQVKSTRLRAETRVKCLYTFLIASQHFDLLSMFREKKQEEEECFVCHYFSFLSAIPRSPVRFHAKASVIHLRNHQLTLEQVASEWSGISVAYS